MPFRFWWDWPAKEPPCPWAGKWRRAWSGPAKPIGDNASGPQAPIWAIRSPAPRPLSRPDSPLVKPRNYCEWKEIGIDPGKMNDLFGKIFKNFWA